jgi:hypothetical protein
LSNIKIFYTCFTLTILFLFLLILNIFNINYYIIIAFLTGSLGIFFIFNISLQRKNILDPIVIYMFFVLMYGLNPIYRATKLYNINELIIYSTMVLMSVLGVIFSTIIGPVFLKRSITFIKPIKNKYLDQSALLLVLLGIISVGTILKAFGGISGFFSTEYGGARWIVLGSQGVWGGGFVWLGMGLLILVFFKKVNTIRYLASISLIIIFIFLLLVGTRMEPAMIALCGLLMFNISNEFMRMNWRKVYILTPILIFIVISFFQFYSLARPFSNALGWLNAFSITIENIKNDPNLVTTWKSGEFIMPGLAGLELIDNDIKFNFGAQYIGDLLYAIPIIGSNLSDYLNYTPLAVWRMETFYPEQAAQGRGLGFWGPAEGYYSFGLFGSFLHTFILGILIYLLSNIRHLIKTNFTTLLYGVSGSFVALYSARADLSWLWSFTAGWGYFIFLVYFIFFINHIIGKKGKKGETNKHFIHY